MVGVSAGSGGRGSSFSFTGAEGLSTGWGAALVEPTPFGEVVMVGVTVYVVYKVLTTMPTQGFGDPKSGQPLIYLRRKILLTIGLRVSIQRIRRLAGVG